MSFTPITGSGRLPESMSSAPITGPVHLPGAQSPLLRNDDAPFIPGADDDVVGQGRMVAPHQHARQHRVEDLSSKKDVTPVRGTTYKTEISYDDPLTEERRDVKVCKTVWTDMEGYVEQIQGKIREAFKTARFGRIFLTAGGITDEPGGRVVVALTAAESAQFAAILEKGIACSEQVLGPHDDDDHSPSSLSTPGSRSGQVTPPSRRSARSSSSSGSSSGSSSASSTGSSTPASRSRRSSRPKPSAPSLELSSSSGNSTPVSPSPSTRPDHNPPRYSSYQLDDPNSTSPATGPGEGPSGDGYDPLDNDDNDPVDRDESSGYTDIVGS